MQPHITRFFLFIIFNTPIIFHAQAISSKVVDAKTNEALPFVNVFLSSKKGVITNAEGKFTLQLPKNTKPTDSLFVSFIGYEKLGKPLQEFTEEVILLNPKAIELNTVIVTNKNLTAEEVIEKVAENIQNNYNLSFTKKKIFFRESNHQNFVKMDYEFKKSTIDELNKPFLDSVLHTLPKKYDYYSEILCDLYGDYSKKNQKINMIKASELYDKTNEIGMSALEDKFNDIIKKNVKPDSYFKIKSGLFGQKVAMDELVTDDTQKDTTQVAAAKEEIEKQKKREVERKKNFANWRKKTLASVLESIFFNEDSNRNFIRKSNRYEFTHVDFTYLGEAAVYIIDFEPKRTEEYKGRIYVNADDFAIVRLDYVNVKPLKSFNLLGISFKQYESTGTLFFEKNKLHKYDLKYLEKTTASRFGIRRPLKIIEKNKHVKGRRKQNELSVQLDMATTASNKYEIVVFGVDESDKSKFDAFKEDNKISAVYLPAYDPEFWKGYNIIEPNQAIKEFKAAE